MESKLYVGNLAYSTTEDELRTLFGQAGTVTSVMIVKDRDTGQSRGFAFVAMGNQSEALRAISMFNSYRMSDRTLMVNIARPREERPAGGGGFERRGGPGGGPGGGGNRRGGPGGGRNDRGGKRDRRDGGQKRY